MKRAPTPAERKRFQAALAATNIEQERTFWNPIVDQLRGQADIDSAVDLLKVCENLRACHCERSKKLPGFREVISHDSKTTKTHRTLKLCKSTPPLLAK